LSQPPRSNHKHELRSAPDPTPSRRSKSLLRCALRATLTYIDAWSPVKTDQAISPVRGSPLRYLASAAQSMTEELIMCRGGRKVLCSRRLAALAAGIACVVTFGVALERSQPASAATAPSKIDRLIGNAIAHHGIKAAIVQATVRGR